MLFDGLRTIKLAEIISILVQYKLRRSVATHIFCKNKLQHLISLKCLQYLISLKCLQYLILLK